jgi:hypothetical protein
MTGEMTNTIRPLFSSLGLPRVSDIIHLKLPKHGTIIENGRPCKTETTGCFPLASSCFPPHPHSPILGKQKDEERWNGRYA